MLLMYTTGFCIYQDTTLLKRAIHLLIIDIHGEGERQWQKKFVRIVVFTSLIPQPFAPNAAGQLKEASKFVPFRSPKLTVHKKLKGKVNLPLRQQWPGNCKAPLLVRLTSCDTLHVGESLADARPTTFT
jgi:hypothetical protein